MNLFRCFLFVAFGLLVSHSSSANDTAESQLRLLVLGDSLAAGYGLAVDESFPAQLEKELLNEGYNVKVINAGVSGDTSAGGLSRLAWVLQDNPDLVLLELGANDALRGLPARQTKDNLDAIINQLSGQGVRIILAGMQAPRNLGAQYTEEFDAIYPELAEKHKVTLYPFFLEGVALDSKLNQPDGIHPNPAGVKVIVDNLLPFIQKELTQLTP